MQSQAFWRRLTVSLLFVSHSAIAGPVTLPDPIAYWSFEEGLADSVSGIVGVPEGKVGTTTWNAKLGERALGIYGPESFVKTVVNVPLDGEALTVSFWFRSVGGNASSGTFLDKSPSCHSAEAGAKVFYFERGHLVYDHYDVGTLRVELDPVVFPPDIQWHHYALTRGGTNGLQYAVYLDGELVEGRIGGAFGNENVPDGEHDTIYIGGYSFGAGREFPGSWSGLIDDVRIYDATLEHDQIRKLIDDSAGCGDPDTRCVRARWSSPEEEFSGPGTYTLSLVADVDEYAANLTYRITALRAEDGAKREFQRLFRSRCHRDELCHQELTVALSEGTWSVDVSVFRDPLCAGDSCTLEPITIPRVVGREVARYCF